jgi:hypothetical protein
LRDLFESLCCICAVYGKASCAVVGAIEKEKDWILFSFEGK